MFRDWERASLLDPIFPKILRWSLLTYLPSNPTSPLPFLRITTQILSFLFWSEITLKRKHLNEKYNVTWRKEEPLQEWHSELTRETAQKNLVEKI